MGTDKLHETLCILSCCLETVEMLGPQIDPRREETKYDTTITDNISAGLLAEMTLNTKKKKKQKQKMFCFLIRLINLN